MIVLHRHLNTFAIHELLRHMIQQADGDDDLGSWPVAVQMDFENGYNNCSREKMCSNVQKWFPELTAYTRMMYGTAGRLFCMSNGVVSSPFGTPPWPLG